MSNTDFPFAVAISMSNRWFVMKARIRTIFHQAITQRCRCPYTKRYDMLIVNRKIDIDRRSSFAMLVPLVMLSRGIRRLIQPSCSVDWSLDLATKHRKQLRVDSHDSNNSPLCFATTFKMETWQILECTISRLVVAANVERWINTNSWPASTPSKHKLLP